MSGPFTCCGACGRSHSLPEGANCPVAASSSQRIDGGTAREAGLGGTTPPGPLPTRGVGTADLREDDFSRPLPARVGTFQSL
jgi:hypothetical protein